MRLIAFLLCLAMGGSCLAGDVTAGLPTTKEDFLAAVKDAYAKQDIKRVHQLTWEEGMSDFDRNQQQQMLDMLVYNGGVEGAEYGPLPDDFMDTPVAFGKRFDVTHKADGILTVHLTPKEATSSSQVSMPYAVISGTYYLVTSKTTDLGWKGPQDKPMMVNVTGHGADKVKTHVKYNASGVDLERDLKSASIGFPGQYLLDVTVTSDSDDTNVTLELRTDAGPFYKSAPLVGKGTLVYHKGDVGGK